MPLVSPLIIRYQHTGKKQVFLPPEKYEQGTKGCLRSHKRVLLTIKLIPHGSGRFRKAASSSLQQRCGLPHIFNGPTSNARLKC